MSQSQRPPAPRPRGTIRVGSVAGVDVLVSNSWFIVAGMIAVLVAPRVEQVEPGLGVWKYVAGVAFAVILYASILLHEAAHALMARRFGYPVTMITLHFLGGFTQIEGETRRAREEFWIAVVGPLTSIAVGGAALFAHSLGPTGLTLMAIEGLAVANLLVGVLNLLPGLPLDGGRVLKAGVWGATRNVHLGTLVAGWIGRVLALAALGWPLYAHSILQWRVDFLDYLVAFVMGLFLWNAASAAIASARLRGRVVSLSGRKLARRCVSVPADTPLSDAVRSATEAQAGAIVVLDHDGQPSGVVNEYALREVPEERRSWVPTSSVARSLKEGSTLPADIAGEALIRWMAMMPEPAYVLLERDGSVFGVLVSADVDEAFGSLGG